MGAFFLTLLFAGLLVAFAHRLPWPRWAWKTARALGMVVFVLGMAFILLMLALNAFDVKWH